MSAFQGRYFEMAKLPVPIKKRGRCQAFLKNCQSLSLKIVNHGCSRHNKKCINLLPYLTLLELRLKPASFSSHTVPINKDVTLPTVCVMDERFLIFGHAVDKGMKTLKNTRSL